MLHIVMNIMVLAAVGYAMMVATNIGVHCFGQFINDFWSNKVEDYE